MRLRMLPTENYGESPSTAQVSVVARNYVEVTYTWLHEGADHDGMLLIGRALRHENTQAVWVDSWHVSSGWMSCSVSEGAQGLLLQGSYPAIEGPDWGWNIHIKPGEQLKITMDNIVPGHDAYQVVELDLRKSL